MKKIIFGIIILGLLASCNKSKKIYNLKEFCDYTIACYKNDNKSEAIGLRIKKDELMSLISSMKMPETNKKYELEATENRDKDGYFDNTILEKTYSEFRASQENDFWQKCLIEEYDYMQTEDFFGYETAEPIVTLKYDNKILRLKIGELIKTEIGWKILGGGPNWK
jgi:hypothetical protein